jgi:hypothetical protein
MFRALCAHHQGVKIGLYSIWYQLVYTKRTSAQSIYSTVSLHVSTRGWSSSGPYNIFRYQMLCLLWDPMVFTVVGYVFATVPSKSL